jgi:modulator of FtsH protease
MRLNMKYVASTAPALDLGVHNKVIRNTYLMLGLTMTPTVIGATAGSTTNFSFLAQSPIVGSLVILALMIYLMFSVSAMRKSIWVIALLFLFTFVAGWWLGSMLQYALNFNNGSRLIGFAAAGTGAIFITLAGVVTSTRKDFDFMRNFLLVGIVLFILASLANLFFTNPAVSLAISANIVLIYSGFILHGVSLVVNGGEANYVMATLGIYLSIYSLFIGLLQLLLVYSGEKD